MKIIYIFMFSLCIGCNQLEPIDDDFSDIFCTTEEYKDLPICVRINNKKKKEKILTEQP